MTIYHPVNEYPYRDPEPEPIKPTREDAQRRGVPNLWLLLEQLTIRVGCETELNRRADLAMREFLLLVAAAEPERDSRSPAPLSAADPKDPCEFCDMSRGLCLEAKLHGALACCPECRHRKAAALVVGGPQETYQIPLNEPQLDAANQWAADDRLWTTQETVQINLRTFARKILALSRPGVEIPQEHEDQSRTALSRVPVRPDEGPLDLREVRTEIASDAIRDWLLAHGFVHEGSDDLLGLAWSHRSGFDFVTLLFWRAQPEVWWVSIRNHASGLNPRVNIGTATSVEDVARIYEAVRLMNGYPSPEDHLVAAAEAGRDTDSLSVDRAADTKDSRHQVLTVGDARPEEPTG